MGNAYCEPTILVHDDYKFNDYTGINNCLVHTTII